MAHSSVDQASDTSIDLRDDTHRRSRPIIFTDTYPPTTQSGGHPINSRRTTRGDIALEAVILGKPHDDEIPAAAWWFLAECLEHSVTVRRVSEIALAVPTAEVRLPMRRARFAAGEALDELDVPGRHFGDAPDAVRPTWLQTPSLRVTVRDLARLVVTHRTTSRTELCGAIYQHLDALWLVDHPA